MHFLIDAQLPARLVDLFKEVGHEATHVMDIGLVTAGDGAIQAYAADSGMIIVTKDEDFAIMRRFSANMPQVVWVRIGNTTNRALRARLKPLMGEILAALADGEALIEVR